MTPEKQAEDLVNEYRIILMNEDTECGNEILCTSIAKKFALILVNKMIEETRAKFWYDVKHQIENYEF
jgi:hypothetical protein